MQFALRNVSPARANRTFFCQGCRAKLKEDKMFQVNESVLYGIQGVCKIVEIAKKTFGKTSVEYYVLRPIYDGKDTRVFVPTQNEALTSKMRRVLSPGEAHEIIRQIPDEEPIWIEDENERKVRYKEILAGGNCRELIRLIKALYLHSRTLQKMGKKLHLSDEHFLKDAEKALYDELAHVLELQRDEVLPFIFEQVQAPAERNNDHV